MHPRLSLRWPPEIFYTALASRQHRAISPARRADRSSPAFIFFTLTTFRWRPQLSLLSIEPFSKRHAHIRTGELPIQFLRQRRRANILRSGGVVVLNLFSTFTDTVRKQIPPPDFQAPQRGPAFPGAGREAFGNSERAERRIFNQIQCNVQDDGRCCLRQPAHEVSETRHRRATGGTTRNVLPTILTGTSQRMEE